MVRREPIRHSTQTVDPERYSSRSYPTELSENREYRSAPRTSANPRRASRKRPSSAQKLRRRLEPVFLSFAALVAFVGLGCSLFTSSQGTTDLASRPFSTVSVTVAPGDTLWSLAQRYEDPSLRPKDRIGLIRQANPNLTTASALVPGQTLMVPVTSSSAVSEIHLAKLAR